MKFKTRKDNPTVQMLARCIQEVESRTQAEVVLVIRRTSGSYRDVDFAIGTLAVFAWVMIGVFTELELEVAASPLPMILIFAIFSRLCHVAGRYGPRRWLTLQKRRAIQVRHSAAGVFFDKKIDQVPEGLGLLLYFSALEQRAELIAGPRIRSALGPRLEELRSSLQDACGGERTIRGSVQRLSEFLRSLGVILERVLPNGGTPHHQILPDEPDLGGEEP